MKIIFRNWFGKEMELPDVKPETTLRDIIHFYKSKPAMLVANSE